MSDVVVRQTISFRTELAMHAPRYVVYVFDSHLT
jgi:hypothetical protein